MNIIAKSISLLNSKTLSGNGKERHGSVPSSKLRWPIQQFVECYFRLSEAFFSKGVRGFQEGEGFQPLYLPPRAKIEI